MHLVGSTRNPRARIAVVMVVVATLALGACASDPDTAADGSAGGTGAQGPAPSSSAPAGAESSTSADDPVSDPVSDPGSEPIEVPEALRFEATTVEGAAFEGASVAGMPVVIWFWAPWCAVCKSQAPQVSDLAEEYGDTVAFLGVGSLDDGDAIRSFAEDVDGPIHLSDPDGDLYQRFGISEQSSFVVLDAQGDEVLRTGYADDDQLANTVADLAS